MRMLRKTGLLFVAFAAGCGAAAASRLVVPVARAGTNPVRWEYTCVDGPGTRDTYLSDDFNKLGAQGWELAASSRAYDHNAPFWCFKRQLP